MHNNACHVPACQDHLCHVGAPCYPHPPAGAAAACRPADVRRQYTGAGRLHTPVCSVCTAVAMHQRALELCTPAVLALMRSCPRFHMCVGAALARHPPISPCPRPQRTPSACTVPSWHALATYGDFLPLRLVFAPRSNGSALPPQLGCGQGGDLCVSFVTSVIVPWSAARLYVCTPVHCCCSEHAPTCVLTSTTHAGHL